jgi:aspartyl/asparaginyl beta-hydroxylase (cupin superfamily)
VCVIRWSAIFGGWPNILSGSASAIIGGVVAASTAWLVVRWTARADRERALDVEARQVALDLVRTLGTLFIGIPDQRPFRNDYETATGLILQLRAAAALLARHRKPLAQQIQDQADALKRKTDIWSENLALQADTAAPHRYNDMVEDVPGLHELVINWLGDVRAVNSQTPSGDPTQ